MNYLMCDLLAYHELCVPIAKIPTTPAIDPINNPLRVISPGSMNA
jgi:hypothetical protein